MSDQVEYRRSADYEERYANNVKLESTVWDIKLVFGAMDQSQPTTAIEQFVAINLSHRQAKLLAWCLEVQIASQEAESGEITIPDAVMPPSPALLAARLPEGSRERVVAEKLAARHAEYFGSPKAGVTTEPKPN